MYIVNNYFDTNHNLWEGSNCAPSTIFLPRKHTFVSYCFEEYMLRSLVAEGHMVGYNFLKL